MNIKVGNRDLAFSAVLQVPPGEDAWVEFTVDTWDVRLNFRFVESLEDPSQAFTLEPAADHATLTFRNWNQPLPAAVATPFEIGMLNGKRLTMLCSGYAVKDFKFMNLSFFWGV